MHRVFRRTLVVAALPLCAGAIAAQPGSPGTPGTPGTPPGEDALRCSALAQLDLQSLRDAPTRVLTARLVDVPAPPPGASPQSGAALLAASPIKQYCQVLGYVAPQVQFELRLPLPASWNRKFFFVTCGGFCGTLDGNLCNPSLARGYASVTYNGGHESLGGFDGTWAANAPNLQDDFGWRGVHVVTVAAKAITASYYGGAIERSYISGCSKGGQSVLSEVQRFPQDYDGAIPSAPVYDFTGQVTAGAWYAQAVHDGNGASLLDSAAMNLVHRSVIERCGGQSGVAEGLVTDPVRCTWRPEILACAPDRGASCLTTPQVAAISKMMRRPTDSKGRTLYAGSQLPGAETEWVNWFFPRDGSRSVTSIAHYSAAQQFTRYMASATPRAGADLLKLSMDTLPVLYSRARAIYNANSPDLRAFKARGGKVLMWHGLSDAAVPATNSIDYYERVTKAMGGREATHDFLRLFLLPGVQHCGGGPGPGTIDAITALENWVERGVAPTELVARRFVDGVELRSRPAFPYPMVARYSGSGNPMQASSFVASDPPTLQYRSPAGISYYARLDTGTVARAASALAAEPRSIDRIIQLGVAQSGVAQFREAIQTFTRGLTIAPDNPMLYRWRGHRHLSVRELDRAMADLTRGFALDSTNYGILYHLGIVRYARGDYAGAANAFARAQRRPPDAGELAGATDWLWMSLMRAGRTADARAMLDRRPDSLPVANAYARRLKLYRGEIAPDSVFTPADTADVQVATLSYGIGNWHLVRGDTARARHWFERSVRSGGWAGFGFILSEIELRRLARAAPR